MWCAACLYIQNIHLFKELGTMDLDITIYGRASSLTSQSKAEMFEKYHRSTDTYYWPIYRQSFLQIPSHWWPGMCIDPGPPLWSGQYGESHLLVIWRCLKMVSQTFRHQIKASVCVCMVINFYLIPATEHVHSYTMWWSGVGCHQRDSWGSRSCSHWQYNLSNCQAALEAPELKGEAHTIVWVSKWESVLESSVQVHLLKHYTSI